MRADKKLTATGAVMVWLRSCFDAEDTEICPFLRDDKLSVFHHFLDEKRHNVESVMDFGNGGTAAGACSDKAAAALSEISIMQALTTSAVGRRSPDSVSKTAFSKTGKFAERI